MLGLLLLFVGTTLTTGSPKGRYVYKKVPAFFVGISGVCACDFGCKKTIKTVVEAKLVLTMRENIGWHEIHIF